MKGGIERIKMYYVQVPTPHEECNYYVLQTSIVLITYFLNSCAFSTSLNSYNIPQGRYCLHFTDGKLSLKGSIVCLRAMCGRGVVQDSAFKQAGATRPQDSGLLSPSAPYYYLAINTAVTESLHSGITK